MQVKTEPQVCTCIEADCNNTFRWVPGYPPIKPKRCNYHENLRKFEKQKEYAQRSRERKQNKKATTKPAPKQKKKRSSWENKPTKNLILHVQYQIVNPYIRERDRTLFKNKCISCEHENIHEAGHRFPISTHPGMRFFVNNIHGQGHTCNSELGGNVEEFDNGLVRRFGVQYYNDLHNTAQLYQQGHLKLMRHEIIEIGKTFMHLHQSKIWVLHQKAFDKYRKIINGDI